MPTLVKNFHQELITTIKDVSRFGKWWSSPINLGGTSGPSGGAGGPVGGIYGLLRQTAVAYDTSEIGYSGILSNLPSGSLLDNLAHMRYRLTNLETISGMVTVLDDGTDLGLVSKLDMRDGLAVTIIDDTAQVFNTGVQVLSGVAFIKNDGSFITTAATILNFEPNLFASMDPTISGQVNITTSGLGLTVINQATTYDAVSIVTIAGSGVSVVGAGGSILITIPGYVPGIANVEIDDEGILVGNVTILNFVGPGVQATVSGVVATITISGGTSGNQSLHYDPDAIPNIIDPKITNGIDFYDQFDNETIAGDWTEYDPGNNLSIGENSYGLQFIEDAPGAARLVGEYLGLNSIGGSNDPILVSSKLSLFGDIGGNDVKFGIALVYDIGGSPKFVMWNMYAGAAGVGLQLEYWSDDATVATTIDNRIWSGPFKTTDYLRLRYDFNNDTIYWDWSSDGLAWITIGNVVNPMSNPPTEAGIFFYSTSVINQKAVATWFRVEETDNANIVDVNIYGSGERTYKLYN